jgi:hypothetical protein
MHKPYPFSCDVRLLAAALPLALGCGGSEDFGSFVDTEAQFATGSDESSGTGGSIPGNPTTTLTSAGSDDGAIGSTGGEDSSGSEGDIDDCDDGTHQCKPPAPQGWTGPVALTVSDAIAESGCRGEFPVPSVTVFEGLMAADAECSCSCGDPEGGSCAGSVDLRFYPTDGYWSPINGQSCNQISSQATVSAGASPLPYTSPMPSRLVTLNHMQAVGGTCSGSTNDPVVDAPLWQARVDACAPVEAPEPCDGDGLCMPQDDSVGDNLCIWAEGDVPCPLGSEYDARTVRHRNYTDERSCTDCTCESGEGQCNDGSVSLRFTGSPIPSFVTLPVQSGCSAPVSPTSYPGVLDRLMLHPGEPEWDACTPAEGSAQPRGGVTPSEPVTFCCAA